MSLPTLAPPSPRRSAVIERATGALLLGFVLWIYSGAMHHDRWPPGHPWSGLTLTMLGAAAVLWPSPRWREAATGSRLARVLVGLLAIGGGVGWFLAITQHPPRFP
jgi:hypothetical protein